MIPDKLHRGTACNCAKCDCNSSESCFNNCKCLDCTHKPQKQILLPQKLEAESNEKFIIRVINNCLEQQITSMDDISALIRKRFGYSSSQVSSAKKKLKKKLLSDYKILSNPDKRQGKRLYPDKQ